MFRPGSRKRCGSKRVRNPSISVGCGVGRIEFAPPGLSVSIPRKHHYIAHARQNRHAFDRAAEEAEGSVHGPANHRAVSA
jgi:hypothetical protein